MANDGSNFVNIVFLSQVFSLGSHSVFSSVVSEYLHKAKHVRQVFHTFFGDKRDSVISWMLSNTMSVAVYISIHYVRYHACWVDVDVRLFETILSLFCSEPARQVTGAHCSSQTYCMCHIVWMF